jgi:uncharacterized OsmC-like protein
MYQLTLDGSKQFDVHYKDTVQSYAVDGSHLNPLEATFSALAGCAGVYAYKACKALGLSCEGISIRTRAVMRSGDLLMPARLVTEVTFPDHFSVDQRAQVLEQINLCAVKNMIHEGAGIVFETREVG